VVRGSHGQSSHSFQSVLTVLSVVVAEVHFLNPLCLKQTSKTQDMEYQITRFQKASFYQENKQETTE